MSADAAESSSQQQHQTSRRVVYGNKTIHDFSPPPLHEPTPATVRNGLATEKVYQYIQEARRQVDNENGEATLRNLLIDHPEVAHAIFSVMLESRKIVAESDGTSGSDNNKVIEPDPMHPPPQLPVGFKSWLQPKQ